MCCCPFCSGAMHPSMRLPEADEATCNFDLDEEDLLSILDDMDRTSLPPGKAVPAHCAICKLLLSLCCKHLHVFLPAVTSDTAARLLASACQAHSARHNSPTAEVLLLQFLVWLSSLPSQQCISHSLLLLQGRTLSPVLQTTSLSLPHPLWIGPGCRVAGQPHSCWWPEVPDTQCLGVMQSLLVSCQCRSCNLSTCASVAAMIA